MEMEGTKGQGATWTRALRNKSRKRGRNIAMDGEEVPIVENNLDKVVIIDPRPIKTTDFNLTPKKKELLILSGRLGALKFIERNYPDIQFDKSRIRLLTDQIEKLRKEI